MEELNIDTLLLNKQIIRIKDGETTHEIVFKKLSAARVFDVAKKWNSIMSQGKKRVLKAIDRMDEEQKKVFLSKTFEQQATIVLSDDIKYSKQLQNKSLDLCFEIIRPVKLIDRIKHRFSGNYISKRWLADNLSPEGLQQFINMVLAPILGEKKTINPVKN